MHHLPWPYPRLLEHCCGGTLAPENTIEAIDVSRAHGYRAVGFEAMLSADQVPVQMHERTLERTMSGGVSAHTGAALE